jgi:hypothetical protein
MPVTPEFEVISMAQTIARTGWAEAIIRVAKDSAPEEFSGDPLELKVWTGLQEAGL